MALLKMIITDWIDGIKKSKGVGSLLFGIRNYVSWLFLYYYYVFLSRWTVRTLHFLVTVTRFCFILFFGLDFVLFFLFAQCLTPPTLVWPKYRISYDCFVETRDYLMIFYTFFDELILVLSSEEEDDFKIRITYIYLI